MVGKRVAHRDRDRPHALSISSAAVALAEQNDRSRSRAARVLVLGAGEVGEGLRSRAEWRGRRRGRRREPHPRAGRGPGRARSAVAPIPLGDLPDVLVDGRRAAHRPPTPPRCTSSGTTSRRSMERRDGAPLLVVDVAVPRDVDPGVAPGPRRDAARHGRPQGVHRGIAHERRRREVSRVQEIIIDELERFRTDRTAREVAPLVTSLRRRGGASCARPSSSASGPSSPGSTPSPRTRSRRSPAGIVNKLLHEPTVRLKDAAGTARAASSTPTRSAELFDLTTVLGPDERPTDDEGEPRWPRCGSRPRGSALGPLAGRARRRRASAATPSS